MKLDWLFPLNLKTPGIIVLLVLGISVLLNSLYTVIYFFTTYVQL